jgi:hypothetical protein
MALGINGRPRHYDELNCQKSTHARKYFARKRLTFPGLRNRLCIACVSLVYRVHIECISCTNGRLDPFRRSRGSRNWPWVPASQSLQACSGLNNHPPHFVGQVVFVTARHFVYEVEQLVCAHPTLCLRSRSLFSGGYFPPPRVEGAQTPAVRNRFAKYRWHPRAEIRLRPCR